MTTTSSPGLPSSGVVGIAGGQGGQQLLKWVVSDIRISGLSKGARLREPKVYLRGKAGPREKWKSRNVQSKAGDAEWTDSWVFEAEPSAMLDLRLYGYNRIGPDEVLGSLALTLSSIENVPITFAQDLTPHKGNGAAAHIVLSAKRLESLISLAAAAEAAVQSANSGVAGMQTASAHIAQAYDAVSKVVSDTSSMESTWDPLLEKLEVFVKIMDDLAEVHPYAKIAWTVISAAYKVYNNQTSRDQKLTDLVTKMNGVYDVLVQARPLQDIQAHREVLKRISLQTIECGHFISSYAERPAFWQRLLHQSASSISSKIEGFDSTFDSLLNDFNGQLHLQTEIMVLRMVGDVKNMESEIVLHDLPRAPHAGYHRTRQCLEGTRVMLLDEITTWATNMAPNTPRVYLLTGPAGTGKSTVAHTIAARMDDMKRLGSSFCFDRNEPTQRQPKHLLPTIARDLADFDPVFKTALLERIGDRLALRETTDLSVQFDNFLLGPATQPILSGPILVMIDGLDEIGESRTRSPLLSLLSTRIAELPPNFRFLLTGRDEKDIMDVFRKGAQSMLRRSMPTLHDNKELPLDLAVFIRSQLADVPGCLQDANVKTLVRMSDGLFQWAHVACGYIVGDGRGGEYPEERYDALVANGKETPSAGVEVNLLDDLYRHVLPRLINLAKPASRSRFRRTMGLLVNAFESLTMEALQGLVEPVPGLSAQDVDDILTHLGSLLSGVSDKNTAIRPLHSSFRDFLTIESRGQEFFIGITASHQEALADSCLHVLIKHLRFNICDLESSYDLNQDIPDLKRRVEGGISMALSYACRFWAPHLRLRSTSLEQNTVTLMRDVKAVLETKLLFWLECLSLLGAVNTAARSLSAIVEYASIYDRDLSDLAKDALRFVRTMSRPITDSAPHIYLSALGSAPSTSLVQQRYGQQINTLKLCEGQSQRWPVLYNILRGHTGPVTSVSFSNDSTHIVSGSTDGTVRIWDAETGYLVRDPLVGHAGPVMSVAFSHDSKRIVSGTEDGTVLIWDHDSGELEVRIKAHRETVNSVSCSADGRWIVSASDDQAVRLWHAETGKLYNSLLGHTSDVLSVSFSQDSKQVVTGSFDGTIRIFDVESTQMLLRQFVVGDRHSDLTSDGDIADSVIDQAIGGGSVRSVTFSNDGKHIVSGSYDGIARIWSSETGGKEEKLLDNHSGPIRSVTFSHDSKRIVSGCDYGLIEIWDAETGERIGVPLKGHSSTVRSVAFSHDSKRILSGSDDETIRIWDAETVEPSDVMHHPDIGWVLSVCFSHDSQRIVCGCKDGTICIWETHSGKPASPRIVCDSGPVRSVSFSPDGKRIVSAGEDGTLRLWDAETGKAAGTTTTPHTGRVQCVCFSHDSKQIVSCSDDGIIRLWNATTGEPARAPIVTFNGSVLSVSFSSDSKQFVSGSYNGTIQIWNTETGKPAEAPLVGHTGSVRSVVFSQDSRWIVSGSYDRTLRIWNIATGEPARDPLIGHTGPVRSVSISHDSKWIVSGSDDRTVRIWDSVTGEPYRTPLVGHTDLVWSVAVSPDSERIASGSYDGTTRIWNIESTVNPNAFCPDKAHHLTQPYGAAEGVRSEASVDFDTGWITYNGNDHFLWLPPDLLSRACVPPCALIIPDKTMVCLDLSRFVHGTRWAECYSPNTYDAFLPARTSNPLPVSRYESR